MVSRAIKIARARASPTFEDVKLPSEPRKQQNARSELAIVRTINGVVREQQQQQQQQGNYAAYYFDESSSQVKTARKNLVAAAVAGKTWSF